MSEYLVLKQYADGGETRLVQVFDNEATAKEYARLKQRRSKEKDGSWADTYYACKRLH